jgi:hypothetical protein
MKKTVGVIALGILAAVCSYGSTISSLTNTVGNSFGINSIGNASVAMNALVGSTLSVTFSDSSSGSCTFANNAKDVPIVGNAANIGCIVSGGGAQIYLNPPNSQTNSAGWVINNLNGAGGLSIVTVTIDLNPSTTLVGFDSTSVATRTGGNVISGSAVLTNALHTSAQSASAATQYGKLILSFSAGAFGGGTSFVFSAANHNLTGPFVADTPEPTTYAMVGIGLAFLGFVKFRRKS